MNNEPVISTNTANNYNSNNSQGINLNPSIENLNPIQINNNSAPNSMNSNDQLSNLPSIPKPVSIQSSTVTLSTINPSQLKNPDYLYKFKATSKTSLTVTIEIPSILFPPKVISDFAVTDVPEKMNITEILDLDEKFIKEHFIPICAKFFTLMSPLSAEYFIKFYSKCISNNADIKNQLRSWIYHNLDVTTIKTDF